MEASPYADMAKIDRSPGAIVQERGQAAVALAVERLDGAVEHLDRCVSMIEERIGGVLSPPTPQPDHDSVAEPLTGVPLADAITQRSRRVQALAANLGVIHERIEL